MSIQIVAIPEGEIVSRADSPVERVWDVRIDGEPFRIAVNDFALGVSIDPQTAEASGQIGSIRDRLLKRRT